MGWRVAAGTLCSGLVEIKKNRVQQQQSASHQRNSARTSRGARIHHTFDTLSDQRESRSATAGRVWRAAPHEYCLVEAAGFAHTHGEIDVRPAHAESFTAPASGQQ